MRSQYCGLPVHSRKNRAMTLEKSRTSLSVLMAVYSREKPAFLAQCLESIAAQTLPADQVVVVKDGPLTPELEAVLAEFAARLPLETPALKENRGTGAAEIGRAS